MPVSSILVCQYSLSQFIVWCNNTRLGRPSSVQCRFHHVLSVLNAIPCSGAEITWHSSSDHCEVKCNNNHADYLKMQCTIVIYWINIPLTWPEQALQLVKPCRLPLNAMYHCHILNQHTVDMARTSIVIGKTNASSGFLESCIVFL